MKNKKGRIIIIGIIVILLLIALFFIVLSKKNNLFSNITKQEIEKNTKNEEINSDNNSEVILTSTMIIKSTKEKPIEKDGIEISNMQIVIKTNELNVETTLKNNTNEDLNGFFIHIDLLDENNKRITSITEGSDEILKAHGEIKLYNNVSGLKKNSEIKDIKIVELEKTSIANNMKENFDISE